MSNVNNNDPASVVNSYMYQNTNVIKDVLHVVEDVLALTASGSGGDTIQSTGGSNAGATYNSELSQFLSDIGSLFQDINSLNGSSQQGTVLLGQSTDSGSSTISALEQTLSDLGTLAQDLGGSSQSAGSQSVGSQSVGSQSVGSQSVGSQTVGSQSDGSQSVGSQSVGSQSVGWQTVG